MDWLGNLRKIIYEKYRNCKMLHPPSQVAIKHALSVCEVLQAENITPQRLEAVSSGGICIIIFDDKFYADMECSNNGDVFGSYRCKDALCCLELILHEEDGVCKDQVLSQIRSILDAKQECR